MWTPPENEILVTIDVSSLYTNISPDEGIAEVEEFLLEREDKSVPTGFLVRMLEQVLKLNTFEFNKKLFLQKISKCPPICKYFHEKN